MRHLWKVVALVVIMSGAACSSSASDSSGSTAADGMRVASFDFAESELLAELYAQSLEEADVPVVRLGRVGPREVVAPALELDRIDLVPEYLGSALKFFGASAISSNSTASQAALADLLAPRGLTALEAAVAQNANAIVTTKRLAADLGLADISDLSAHAATLRFGGTVECPDRPLCLAGLKDLYGLEFASFVPQSSLAVTAEALRLGEIEVGLMFTTAAELADPQLTLLRDDLGLQPPENVIPLLRQSALDRWGTTATQAINDVAALLTTDDLREMNRLVDDGSQVAEVASSWLMSHGLSSPG
jgi:osmoprotectant transport system substrate-binding protein